MHRDSEWDTFTSHQRLNEVTNQEGCGFSDNKDSGNTSTFPLDHNVSSTFSEDMPAFSDLDTWFQVLVIHTAVLTFGLASLEDGVRVHPAQLLPPSVISFY